MGHWRGATVVGLVVTLVAAGLAWADPAGRDWRRQPIAGQNIVLVGVSCSSETACTALGGRGDGGPMVVERWNGRRWSIQRFPTPTKAIGQEPGAVSCPAAGSCFAVGDYELHGGGRFIPLVERWNGRRWSSQHVPRRHSAYGDLQAISCTSPAACLAVGSSWVNPGRTKLLVERWNGRRWSQQKAALPSDANFGFLDGVSCVSAHECIAVGAGYVGYQISPLAERWNGHGWSSQTIPGLGMGGLSGVSCPSAMDCMAVGNNPPSNRTLAERWDGHHWSIQRTPNPGGTKATAQNSLRSVSCPSDRACTAVGAFGTFKALVEHWNGSRWSRQSTPDVGVASSLSGVTCISPRVCTAVGFYDSHSGSARPLAERS